MKQLLKKRILVPRFSLISVISLSDFHRGQTSEAFFVLCSGIVFFYLNIFTGEVCPKSYSAHREGSLRK